MNKQDDNFSIFNMPMNGQPLNQQQSNNNVQTNNQMQQTNNSTQPVQQMPQVNTNIQSVQQMPQVNNDIQPVQQIPQVNNDIQPVQQVSQPNNNVQPVQQVSQVNNNVQPVQQIPQINDNMKPISMEDHPMAPPKTFNPLGTPGQDEMSQSNNDITENKKQNSNKMFIVIGFCTVIIIFLLVMVIFVLPKLLNKNKSGKPVQQGTENINTKTPDFVAYISEGSTIGYGDFFVETKKVEDNGCSLQQTCSNDTKYEFVVTAGIGSNLSKYTLNTKDNKIHKVANTNYSISAGIEDGSIVVNIYEN